MNILAVDIGGTHLKFRTQKQSKVIKVDSGPKMTPVKMMAAITAATKDWKYDCVSLGYPGVVVHNLPISEPHNLAKGWVKFKYQQAFNNLPLRMLNDAAMQALGSYRGGRMLFLGLGTGLGSALVVEGVVQAMELAHLPWKKGKTYEDFLGDAGLEHYGKKVWSHNLMKLIEELQGALECEYIVLGGGNAKLVKDLPKHVELGGNDNAFKGAFMLWEKAHETSR